MKEFDHKIHDTLDMEAEYGGFVANIVSQNCIEFIWIGPAETSHAVNYPDGILSPKIEGLFTLEDFIGGTLKLISSLIVTPKGCNPITHKEISIGEHIGIEKRLHESFDKMFSQILLDDIIMH